MSKCFSAANIRIEAAAVVNDKTFHLDFDRNDFIMLSPNIKYENDETPFKRKYHAYKIADYTSQITNNEGTIPDFLDLLAKKEAYFRVRVHAYHEFTGFGKAFEAQFEYRNNVFTPKTNKNVCKED
jgi:hypothetical protein